MKERKKTNLYLFFRIFIFLAFLASIILTSYARTHLNEFILTVDKFSFSFDDVTELLDRNNYYTMLFIISIGLGILFGGMLFSYFLEYLDKTDLKDAGEDLGVITDTDKS